MKKTLLSIMLPLLLATLLSTPPPLLAHHTATYHSHDVVTAEVPFFSGFGRADFELITVSGIVIGAPEIKRGLDFNPVALASYLERRVGITDIATSLSQLVLLSSNRNFGRVSIPEIVLYST